MIESWFFVVALFAVLLIPGPANALLASSAYHQGIAKTIHLIPAEILGYLYGIAMWALLIHLSMPIWPNLMHWLHLVSVIYVMWLAFHLWKSSQLKKQSQLNLLFKPSKVFIHTLKNPKVILLTVGVLPVQTWNSLGNYILMMGIVCLSLLACALLWMYFGRALLAGELKRVRTDQLYKGSVLLLIICMLPMVYRIFML